MDTTRTNLLLRVRDWNDAGAWNEFYKLYAPLLYRYARRRGLSSEDAREVRDESLKSICEKIRTFTYDRKRGRFKAWLRCIVERRVADHLRKHRPSPVPLDDLSEVPDSSQSCQDLWEEQWEYEHLAYCLAQVRGAVPAVSYEVFGLLLEGDCTVPEICERLGITRNQVYKAKARVLDLVRKKLAEFELADLG